ncbi:axonemal dynein light intermediate polypeptide 1 isoform X2 [Electrophorus electricus]|uniref:Axonemal dynein light intermediate polypeptide 1 n=1 Tax=Electrophorus electricus TaxID=8005 RepID=A0A4W4ENH5_ELEEL|nr:axonemal dynein light intermediate polypeptide 1 isoform X2 [Electrophorus electricus]
MIPPGESLLKYDNPVLVSRNTEKKPLKARPLKVSPQDPAITGPVPPPPKPKSPSADAIIQQTGEILNSILPPREWMENNQLWVQQVSSTPCTRMDLVHLQEQLDLKLQQRQARETGICPVRRELYSQCFDELIRQVTINCAERGLLLLRVRDEIRMTIAAYQTLYESSMAFGMRKALQAEQDKPDMAKRISDLENEKRDLERQVNEQKAKCEAIERRETERRQVEEKKHTEETQFLKRTNQQLKAQLEGIIAPKK